MIVERIYHWAKTQPDRTALIWNDISLNYLSFANAIQLTYGFLQRENLPVSGSAIVLVQSLSDAWIIVMALRALGLNTICVRSNEQAQSLRTRDAACVVTTHTEAATYNLATNASNYTKVVAIPSPAHSIKDRTDLLAVHNDRRPFGGHILYTSGTTGIYKKVLMSGEFEDRRNHVRAQFYSFDRRTIYHGVDFELWTGTGFKTPSAIWQVGGCVVLDERKESFKNFFSHRVDFAQLLPWQLKHLLAQTRDLPERPIGKFALSVGGGFLPSDLAERCIQELTDRLTVYYTATEINSVRLISEIKADDDLHWLMPTDEKRVQIVDESGAECQINREGELRILLSDIDCHDYLDDKEASAKVFRDGFFYPGDMAVKRDDGRIRILGRIGDVVVLKGEKVATGPLEQKIQRKLQAEEVCLFSGLSKKGEDELIIAIQSNRGIPRSQLEAIAREFPRFEKVRFFIRPDFPRVATGRRKINRALLKKLVFEELDRHER
jgi:acyl-coenzyme A synthetase/AMP-(fatty) acid ligase